MPSPTRRLRLAYEDAISKITKRVLAPKKPEQSLDSWLAELSERSRTEDVRRAAETVAERMITQVNVKNARSWREAAARSNKPRRLYTALKQELHGPVGFRMRQLRRENAALISSVTTEAAKHLVHEIDAAVASGARPGTISKMARARFPKLLRSRIKLIARTEAQKTSAALTQARAENVGVFCYIWETSMDARVRDSHRKMQGVVIFYVDPPSPEALVGEKSSLGHYHSGDCPNDRCTQSPILEVDDISFPCKAYSRGSIKSYNKQAFVALAKSYGFLGSRSKEAA